MPDYPKLPPRPDLSFMGLQPGLSPQVDRVWGRMQMDPEIIALLRAVNMKTPQIKEVYDPYSLIRGAYDVAEGQDPVKMLVGDPKTLEALKTSKPTIEINTGLFNEWHDPYITRDAGMASTVRHEIEHMRQFRAQAPQERARMGIGEHLSLDYADQPTENEARKVGNAYGDKVRWNYALKKALGK